MRRWIFGALGAVIVLGTIGGCYYYFDVGVPFLVRIAESEILVVGLGFLRGFVYRFGGRRVILLFALPFFLPRVRRFLRNLDDFAFVWCRRTWREASLRTKALMTVPLIALAIVLMLMAGASLGLVALFPLPVPAFVGLWLKGKILPFVARFALGRWVTSKFPYMVRIVPAPIRGTIRRSYRRLWVWTMRKMIGTRERARKRIERRIKRHHHKIPQVEPQKSPTN